MDIKKVHELAGGVVALSLKLGLSRGAASQWDEIPVEHVIKVCGLCKFKVTPHELRPDIYPHPDDGLPEELRKAA